MEFERREKYLVSGLKDLQIMETALITGGYSDGYGVQMEGDVVVDDGYIHYGVFTIDLNPEEAQKLYDELGHWLNERNGSA